jgi:hypothetical protein
VLNPHSDSYMISKGYSHDSGDESNDNEDENDVSHHCVHSWTQANL